MDVYDPQAGTVLGTASRVVSSSDSSYKSLAVPSSSLTGVTWPGALLHVRVTFDCSGGGDYDYTIRIGELQANIN